MALSQSRQQLIQLHQMLLDMLRLEQWDAVEAGIPRYLAATEQIMAAWQQAIVPEEKAATGELLQRMQRDQAEIIGGLRARRAWLEARMVTLQQSKSGCQHYAAQTPGGTA